MKTTNFLFCLLFVCSAITTSTAQTVDEIIDTYFENTGGKANWEKLESLTFTGYLNFDGMKLPVSMVQTKDGLTSMSADIQGQKFYQTVYDGEVLWSTNQMTMEAERSDAEATTNYKMSIQDFPDPFLNYKSKGYTAQLVGKETIEGTETYKIRLEKKALMVDGKSQPNVEYYYFDTENFVPIVVEEEVVIGPESGTIGMSKLSDYQEVDGIYFPFSIIETAKGQPGGQAITITSIEINSEIDPSMFKFPVKN